MSTGIPSLKPTSSTKAPSKLASLGRTAKRLAFSGGMIALFDQVIVSATNFGTNIAVGKSSSLDELGVYTLAVSLLYFCRSFQEQLVASPYTVYRQRMSEDELPAYNGSSCFHQIVATILTFVLVAIVAIVARLFASSDRLAPALFILLLAYPFFMFREFFRKLAFAQFRFATALTMDIGVITLQLGLCFALWWFDQLGSVTVFAAIAISSIAACVYWLSKKEMKFDFRRDRFVPDWIKNWNFSKWALCTFFMGCSTPYLMPWFVAWVRDRETSALYFTCATLVGLANMVLNGINNLLGPTSARAFAEGGVPRLWNILLKATAAVAALLVPFCLFVWLAGGWLPHLVLRDTPPDLRLPLFILAGQLLVSGIGTVAGNGLWAIDRPNLNIVADATLLVTTFGSAYWLVPDHGVSGAAAAVLIGAVLAAILRWFAFCRQVGFPKASISTT
jgi:O-antigen/teichoic acid export membrane protein